MANLYDPVRSPEESLERYHHRLRVSRLAANQTTRLAKPAATSGRRMRRQLFKALGGRRAKKMLRQARADRKAAEPASEKLVAALAARTGPQP